MSISIRPAQEADLARIVAIYNQAIAQKGLTADLDFISVQDRLAWLAEHDAERYPILVATDAETVIGWIALSAYRPGRRALKSTVEVSLYIANSHIGRGVGSDMMNCMLPIAQEMGYEHMMAILIATNERSVGLFAKYGFDLWGRLPNIVVIDGQQFDHCIYGRAI